VEGLLFVLARRGVLRDLLRRMSSPKKEPKPNLSSVGEGDCKKQGRHDVGHEHAKEDGQ